MDFLSHHLMNIHLRVYKFLITDHSNVYRHSTLIWFYCHIIISNRLSNKILFSLHYYSKRDDHNHHLYSFFYGMCLPKKKNIVNRMNKKSLVSHCAITSDNIVEDKCLMSIRLTTVDLHICAFHTKKKDTCVCFGNSCIH